jgi:predicted  nucleic acid-binding Zn-ribbon protein
MPTMAEMVEAHLMNVQREVSNLNDRRNAIEKEIEKLQQYLQEGQATLLEAKSTTSIKQQSSVMPSIFNP